MAAKKTTKKRNPRAKAAAEKAEKADEKKAEKKEESGADHYAHFLDCMAEFDDAETAAAKKKWKKKAAACFKKLEKHADDLSAAKLKRARRVAKSLDD